MLRALCIVVCLYGSTVVRAQQFVVSTVAGGAPPVTPAPAVSSSIGDPARVATDSSGNFYFAGLHTIFKVDPNGTLTRVAGTGRSGYSGDGGPATNAQFVNPDGIALDAAGNLFVTDKDAHVVRRVAADGTISTVAGIGTAGYSGDGGPATGAQFNGPTGVAVDAAGNLYVADTANNCVRKVTSGGTITTVAGNGNQGYGGDGGAATGATLNGPQGLALDASGNLYIADTYNDRVRMVAPNGTIGTVAGTGISSFSGDGSAAAGATLVLPTDVAVDQAGNLYIADFGNSRVRLVTQGVINTVAGSSDGDQPADNLAALNVRFNGPTGIAVDPAGNLYLAEGSVGSGSGLAAGDFKIWKISAAGILSTAAGNGWQTYAGDGAAASLAQFNAPTGVALDSAGNLFVADSLNNRVRKVAPDGTITTVAGNGLAGFSGDAGPATSAQLKKPVAVAVDPAGNLFITDSGNQRVRKVFPDGTIGTVAGNGNAGLFGDGDFAWLAALHDPRGIAVDAYGRIYIADTGNHRVREVMPDGRITTLAGTSQGFSGDGGPAVNAQLNSPADVALDPSGNLYVADQGNNRVREILSSGNIITFAGASSGDLSAPGGLALDSTGNLYIADSGHNQVRQVSASNGSVPIAGTGTCCYSGDGGPAAGAQFFSPTGLAADPSGRVYIADTGNNAVRILQPATLAPAVTGVVNAASNQPGPVAPGEVVVVQGAAIGPARLLQGQPNPDGSLATQLGGAGVLFNGIAGQVVYTSFTQVSAVVPSGISGTSVQIVAQYGSTATAPLTVPLAAVAPALFTRDSSGIGQAAAFNQDGTANSAGNPAAPGSYLTLYATGVGRLNTPLSVTFAGAGSPDVQASAGGGGIPAGVVAVRAQVPSGIAAGGAVPVILVVASTASPVVTVAVSSH